MKLMKLQEVDVSDMMDTDNDILAHNQTARFWIPKWTNQLMRLL